MADLIAKSPCDGLMPVLIGEMSLTELAPEPMTLLAPFRGQHEAASQALKAAHGLALPRANRTNGKPGNRVIWFGRGQFLLIGPEPAPDIAECAALVDQSDAWAGVRLEGVGCEDVLARLVPIDVRQSTFRRGHTARTQVMHMMGSLTRIGDRAFQIMVFRSMARTLVHDLETAMEAVAARG